ncbi:MAG: serine/threonine-protein kinase, partial [Myxococcota bacterium]
AGALGGLKAMGIIHRDIKPENVIVDDHGIAKITDFGIARETVATGRMTDTGVGVGSILYASPEQIQGEGDHRSDIYSLGCTLYFMLTGVDPFDADQPVEKVLMAKLRQPPRLSTNLSGVPRAVSDILRRMLAPKPERRYQTYLEIEAAIDGILSGSKSRIRDAGRSVVWAGAGLAAVLIALALWGLWHYG